MKPFYNRQGFTLIELIVTLLILGVLVLLAILVIPQNLSAAEEKTCAGNRRSLLSTALFYKTLCNEEDISVPESVDPSIFADPNNDIKKQLLTSAPVCPGNGSYTLYFNDFRCECTVHEDIVTE